MELTDAFSLIKIEKTLHAEFKAPDITDMRMGLTCTGTEQDDYIIRVGVKYHNIHENEDDIINATRAYTLLEDENAAKNGYDRATVEAYPVLFLECYLDLNREGTIKLPKDIVLGQSTLEDMQTAYGEATSTETSWEQTTLEAFETRYFYGESPKTISFDVQFKQGPCASWIDNYLNKINSVVINLTGQHDPRF